MRVIPVGRFNISDVGKRIGNLDDLPKEIRSQLQCIKTNSLEKQIMEVINCLQGMANIDEILVGMFREHDLLMERSYLSKKLYQMKRHGLLESIKGTIIDIQHTARKALKAVEEMDV